MIRLCWVFVLLAVVVQSDARNDSPMDCQEWQAAGNYTTGVYTVVLGGNAVRVRCDMDTDGGGWTVIQRRGNFSQQENFDRDWQDYKNGFGNLERDFWLGNDNIFALTNQGDYSLRVEMTAADGESMFVVLREFRIENESANYTLHVGEKIRFPGIISADDITFANNKMFSTRDRKVFRFSGFSYNCAEYYKGGFWYNYYCNTYCNPNGLYKPGVDDETSMHYVGFRQHYGLSSFEMKIKRL